MLERNGCKLDLRVEKVMVANRVGGVDGAGWKHIQGRWQPQISATEKMEVRDGGRECVRDTRSHAETHFSDTCT